MLHLLFFSWNNTLCLFELHIGTEYLLNIFFLERPSPPETAIKEQLLNLISAERVSYFLLYYTGKMDTKHRMKDHSWIWKKLLLITWLSKIWCILHLWIETLIIYIYTSIYLVGLSDVKFLYIAEMWLSIVTIWVHSNKIKADWDF